MTPKQGPPNTDTETPTPNDHPADTVPALGIDLMIFAHHLKGSGLSKAEQMEYLTIFWQIASAFADIGHGLSPLQTACGKDPQNADNPALLLHNMILSETSKTHVDEEVPS